METLDSMERSESNLGFDGTGAVWVPNTSFFHLVRKLHPSEKWGREVGVSVAAATKVLTGTHQTAMS